MDPIAATPYDWNSAFPMMGQPSQFSWLNGASGQPAQPSYLDMSRFQTQAQTNPLGGANWAQPSPAAAGAGGAGGGMLGWLGNYQNLGTVAQGLGALTQAYLGYKGLKQAKEGLAFQKEAFNANLNNSISTYNTSLEDRIRGRTSEYLGKENDVNQYLDKHRLKR